MPTAAEIELGLYVYSFIRGVDSEAIENQELLGLVEEKLLVVCEGDVAAVVSPIPNQKIRPQRKLLSAHQRVVTSVAAVCDMLPVAFGLIADSEAELRELLSVNELTILEQLERVGGQCEMNVSLTWTADNIFQYFVGRYPELSQARDLVASGSASREDMIEVGRTFDRLLSTARQEQFESISFQLRDICTEIDTKSLKSESEVANINCLMSRDNEQRFLEAIEQLAEQFSDDFVIKLSGPWPPYSFVHLVLSQG